MPDRRTVDELSIEELEQILRVRKAQARQERLRHLAENGRRKPGAPITKEVERPNIPTEDLDYESFVYDRDVELDAGTGKTLRDRLLLGIEMLAVVGIVAVLIFAAMQLRDINADAASEQAAAVESAIDLPTATATPIISAVVLPGGHTVTETGEGRQAQPNYEEVPAHLRPMVEQQFAGPVIVPTPGPGNALSVRIPAIGVDAPVVQGDGWAQLKRGVGQHIGTANPGEDGNMVLSAHNDVFGSIFRHLEDLQEGDEIIVTTTTREYVYRVSHSRIVEPTEVSVMAPTREPIVTLISCWPYLVNNQRIVVVGVLES